MSTLPTTDDELSLNRKQFYSVLAKETGKGYRPQVDFLGAFSYGSRYKVEDQAHDIHFYLLTDLTAPSQLPVSANIPSTFLLERAGQTSVTVGAGAQTGFTNVALSPVLPDVATNYRLQGT